MKIAMLAPIAWATPPAAYGPWEQVTSHLTEGLVARGVDVTLFATGTSKTAAKHVATVAAGYAERPGQDAKVLEYEHVSQVMDRAREFDLIHNQFDFMPLTYSRLAGVPMVTTVHGFSSERIVPIYRRYNDVAHYVSISDANRHPSLDYAATVYNGIDTSQFTVRETPGDYLLYFGRIHPEKGAKEAVQIAQRAGLPLVIAGLIQDEAYWTQHVLPHVDDRQIRYVGNVGPTRRDELLGGALALIHYISFAEPFGLSVAEAMCCGTPVIAPPLGSMPELIDDGENGFLVNSIDEALGAVRGCNGRCTPPEAGCSGVDRRSNAKAARERFSVGRMVDGYLEVYRRVLAGQ